MKPRAALLSAAALTTFLLVLIGGVAARLIAPPPADAETVPPDTAATVDPQLAERDAAYRQQIAQANARLREAYARQQQLADENARLSQRGTTPAADQVTSPADLVSPQAALEAALRAAPDAGRILGVELVEFQGSAAYEIVLDIGTLYIDAHSAQVLYDGTAPTIGRARGATGGESDEHERSEHEDSDD